MKIANLSLHPAGVYTSNVYLLTGSWNAIGDINTLIDVGRDPGILSRIDEASTGVGKKRVGQAILTHCHYDHSSLLSNIKELYNPIVYAFSPTLPGVDIILKGGEALKIADRLFEVIHTPGHSSDSICLYCQEDRLLFSGDTQLWLHAKDSSFGSEFITALEYLCTKDIAAIYPGHGAPLFENCRQLLLDSLALAKGLV